MDSFHSKAFNCLLSISYMLLFLTAVSADPFKFNCTGDGYTNQSMFETNLNNLLSSLTSKAALGFYGNDTKGGNPNLVYGLFLCKGDITTDKCQTCIQTASKDIILYCQNSKQAILWYEPCQLRYSDRNFFGLIDTSTGFYLYNSENTSSPSTSLAFISNLTKEVQTRPSMFGTSASRVQSFGQSIYGLAQCTKDLSSDDCGKCLNEVINQIESCCLWSKGWRYLSASCNIRYEAYSFFNGSKPYPHYLEYKCPHEIQDSQLFITNLNQLLSIITTKAPPWGFNVLSVGENPDLVYGLVLCRGDVSSDNCLICLQIARDEIKYNCPNRANGIIWFDGCLLHYSNQSFTGVLDNTIKGLVRTSFDNISRPDNADFNPLTLFTELQEKAPNRTTIFAADRVRISKSEMRYGLVQCTRDLSADDCRKCLRILTTNLSNCCAMRTSYRYYTASCTIRYDNFPFYNTSAPQIFPPHPTSTQGKDTKPSRAVIYSSVAAAFVGAMLLTYCVYYLCQRRPHREREGTSESNHGVKFQNFGPSTSTNFLEVNGFGENDDESQELPLIDFSIIQQATNNFSDDYKLGQGGFGPVYKGILPDGNEVAVKRLSRGSEQGMGEFNNEVKLIAKLQHRNLVRLLGCCMETEEMILVYEYMPNTSLDGFLYG
ncbi:cysteine-rich receptor-like protein kinase 25 [Tasmannia lanceolata]|uniref:cysteine-rich receptor-like protein kinase 25 n=1 Tax=Tasmannia lanceolata TaxID=3420 RepID=UPI0040643C54